MRDGAVLTFFSHNFPDRVIAGAADGVTSEEARSEALTLALALALTLSLSLT